MLRMKLLGIIISITSALTYTYQADIAFCESSCCPTIITAANIAPGGIAGSYTITQSGCYVLCEDVEITSFTNDYAIVINSNNVILDLNGKSITRLNGIGGCIDSSNDSNIFIKNGTISRFNQGPVSFTGCNQIKVDNVRITHSTGYSAIFLNSCSCCAITNCEFTYGNFNATGFLTIIGIVATFAKSHSHLIENCVISCNNASNASNLIGILVSDPADVTIRNCQITNNTVTNNALLRAIYINRGADCTIDHCQISSNNALSGGVDGIFINLTNGCYINQCAVTNNKSTTGSTNGIFLNKTDSALVEECRVQRNSITDNTSTKDVTGIRLGSLSGTEKSVCTACNVRNNIVIGNNTVGTGNAKGILVLNTGISSNFVTHNIVGQNTSTTNSVGIDLDNESNAFGNKVYGHTNNYAPALPQLHRITYNMTTGTGFGSSNVSFDLLSNVEFI